MKSVVLPLFMILLIGCGTACAQTTDSETFRIRVPGEVSINATNHFAALAHDETDNNQTFPWQLWEIVSRGSKGAIVTFETDHAFTNTSNSSSKRDVQLVLEIDTIKTKPKPKWKLIQGTDQTDYNGGDEVAVVSADSKKAGPAYFRLQVNFIEESFASLQAGDYELTVTGTISPK